MTVRWRARVGSGRRAVVLAAAELLEMDGYRARLGGEDPAVEVAHRAAVERTLSPGELAVVDRVVDGRVWGCVADFVAGRCGGPAPERDDVLEALTLILGREPRRGG